MKRIIFFTLFSFLLAVSVGLFEGQSAEFTYCTAANEAAKKEERRSILINPNGSFRMLMQEGDCNSIGMCILYEFFGPCGTIKQQIDRNNDGKCDQVLEWQAIVDPQYGVFWILNKIHKKCPQVV